MQARGDIDSLVRKMGGIVDPVVVEHAAVAICEIAEHDAKNFTEDALESLVELLETEWSFSTHRRFAVAQYIHRRVTVAKVVHRLVGLELLDKTLAHTAALPYLIDMLDAETHTRPPVQR
jgi:hypothetical protein